MKDLNHHTPPALWDEQYSTSRWDYLSSLEQLPRYALIAAWIERLRPNASVLDLGCGEGILLEWLRRCTHYEGVDFSQAALTKARDNHPSIEPETFHCASVETFYQSCQARFDCVVINEVLYYCANPIRLLARYERLLKPGGYLIISITGFESKIWKDVQAFYGKRFALCVRIEDCRIMKSWNLAAIVARGQSVLDSATD